MKYSKLSITVEEELASELRRTAGTRGVSALVNEAIRQHLQAGRVRELLRTMDEESGPVPDEIVDAVRSAAWPE